MKKLIFFGVLSTTLFLACLMILITSIRPNIISLNYNIPLEKNLKEIIPQGWAFFTKDPFEGYSLIYEKKEGVFKKINLKSSAKSQFYGIKRTNRLIVHKIKYFIKNIDDKFWYTYKGEVNNIPQDSLSKITIKAKQPIIYGEFLIAKGEPIPYSWYKSSIEVIPKMAYIKLEITNE